MVDLTKLSGPKLEALYERLMAEGSTICRELIAQGYGNEKHKDTLERAIETGDKLAMRFKKNSDEFFDVVEELRARKTYHGGTQPIRRR